jgi:hypothetical protein
MRRCPRAMAICVHLVLVAAALWPQSHAAAAPRVVNEALAFGQVVSGTVAPLKYAAASAPSKSTSPPSQSDTATPAPPPAPVPASAFCYNVTVDPAILSTVVFWKGKSLYAHMQTCSGMPLLRASVYGCPSIDPSARVVWQYMSPAMMSSQSQRAAPLPADWEWQSDSQAMAFELTHQTFYIEVVPHPNATVDSSFQLSTYLFDSTVFPKEKLHPMTNTLGWNKTLEQRSLTSTTSSFGADPNAGNIQAHAVLVRQLDVLLTHHCSFCSTSPATTGESTAPIPPTLPPLCQHQPHHLLPPSPPPPPTAKHRTLLPANFSASRTASPHLPPSSRRRGLTSTTTPSSAWPRSPLRALSRSSRILSSLSGALMCHM